MGLYATAYSVGPFAPRYTHHPSRLRYKNRLGGRDHYLRTLLVRTERSGVGVTMYGSIHGGWVGLHALLGLRTPVAILAQAGAAQTRRDSENCMTFVKLQFESARFTAHSEWQVTLSVVILAFLLAALRLYRCSALAGPRSPPPVPYRVLKLPSGAVIRIDGA